MMRRWIACVTAVAVAVLAAGCSDDVAAPKVNSSVKGKEMPTGTKSEKGKAAVGVDAQ